MTWRHLLIDRTAAIVDGVAAACRWLNAQARWWLTLVWYAYWIVVATGAVLCLLMAALTLVTVLMGVPWLLPPDPSPDPRRAPAWPTRLEGHDHPRPCQMPRCGFIVVAASGKMKDELCRAHDWEVHQLPSIDEVKRAFDRSDRC